MNDHELLRAFATDGSQAAFLRNMSGDMFPWSGPRPDDRWATTATISVDAVTTPTTALTQYKL